MQYDDFVSSVQPRGDRPRDETETLVHASLRVLAERLTAGEADDLRAQLPGGLQADLIPPEPEAQPFGPNEFARRVARMARMPESEAREGMVAVLATTRDAVEPGEFDDVRRCIPGVPDRSIRIIAVRPAPCSDHDSEPAHTAPHRDGR